MKKTLLTFILVSCFLVPAGISQEEGAEKTDKPQEEQTDVVISTLEAAKNGQVRIDKTSEQLAREKEQIEQQKTELVNSNFAVSDKTPEVEQQLKVLEKQEQLIEAKKEAIEESLNFIMQ